MQMTWCFSCHLFRNDSYSAVPHILYLLDLCDTSRARYRLLFFGGQTFNWSLQVWVNNCSVAANEASVKCQSDTIEIALNFTASILTSRVMGLVYWHGFTWRLAWINNCINIYWGGDITCPCPNSSGSPIKFWGYMIFDPIFYWVADYLSMLGLGLIHVGKRVPAGRMSHKNELTEVCSTILHIYPTYGIRFISILSWITSNSECWIIFNETWFLVFTLDSWHLAS